MTSGDDRADGAQQETAAEILGAIRGEAVCRPGEHRCLALMLGFFAIQATGDIDDLTRAAVARCEAGQGVGL
jgi:hypothetical protein